MSNQGKKCQKFSKQNVLFRIFNIFANKVKSEDPRVEDIIRLKRKLGKL